MASPGSQAKGFHDAGKMGRDKGKTSDRGGPGLGAGASALGRLSFTQPRDPAGPNGAISGGPGEGPGAKSYSNRAERGGGTTTTEKYVPGALGSFPNADILTVLEKIVGPLVPGVGGMLGIAGAKQAIEDPSKTSTVLGGNPGPQRGWQPDRYRGAASLGGIGGSGGAVNSGEREIAGQSIATRVRPNVSKGEADGLGTGNGVASDQYSDVMMKDRRKPGLKQMLETML